MSAPTRIFFATDIHGSTRCFRKFLNSGRHYKASVIIIGGDITGKIMIPIVRAGREQFRTYDNGREIIVDSESAILAFEAKAADAGAYTYRCSPDEYQHLRDDELRTKELFSQLIRTRIEEWIALADDRLEGADVRAFVNPGNDDALDIDPIIDSSRTLQRPEGRVVELDSYCTMISTGFTNVTPFGCPRDIPENELDRKITSMVERVPDVSRCVFNLHCPPHQSQLDNAPKLGDDLQPRMTAFGLDYIAAGSTAVRRAIELNQPLLGLHGHIHESRGVAWIGRTMCINPGSEYHEGVLRGAIVQLERGQIKHHTLTCG